MKRPLIVLGMLSVLFLLDLALTVPLFPDPLATHFDAHGQPNGWMTRPQHLACAAALGFSLPGLIIGIFYTLQFLPPAWFNLPHRDYWLAPERRQETFAYLSHHGAWLAGLSLLFVASIHHLILAANQSPSRQLSNALTLMIAGFYLAGVLGWVIALLRRFQKIKSR